ncbi:hypothetical protein G6F35_018637 [Rhizopus arrhizus]|nr:hypothetical protein G6F35_018637 [Rhizopus arrhizus]
MYVVSGISGAKAADMAAVAPVLFPEMRKRGADEGDLPGADHHWVRHWRIDHGAVHRRPAAGSGPGRDALSRRLVAQSPRRPEQRS